MSKEIGETKLKVGIDWIHLFTIHANSLVRKEMKPLGKSISISNEATISGRTYEFLW